MMAHLRVLLPLLATWNYGSCLTVWIKNDGAAVHGANVTFTAYVSDYNGEELFYLWYDNAQPQHTEGIQITSDSCNWTISYPKEYYEAREYRVDVQVKKQIVIVWYTAASNHTYVNITDELTGDLSLSQNKTRRPNEFVAVNVTVDHEIELDPTDRRYLKENATSVVTHWFLDCIYMGAHLDYKFEFSYNDLNDHNIDALIVADTHPTTTTTTTTTPKLPPKTTTPKPPSVNTTEVIKKKRGKRDVQRLSKSVPESFTCDMGTIPYDPKKIYGHYKKIVSVRDPIRNISVSGNNWLQHGDLLNLQFKCGGSPPFDYCTRYIRGAYNATGNETCKSTIRTESCDFPIIHYFSEGDVHTTLFIIGNQLGRTVWPVTINIYKVKQTAQLSVIVVPVVFCLVAAILVVFGVAYYIQSRSRFTVEVADFDFGQQYTHLDYKTFVERLRDSFNNALNITADDEDNARPGTSSNKYGPMT